MLPIIGKLNHIAIAVPNAILAKKTYELAFAAQVSDLIALPEHGVSVVFITLPNTKIELLEPLGDNSPIQNFLIKNPNGGIHHICLEVKDIKQAKNQLQQQGYRTLGDIKIGAHGKPVLFLHPKDFHATLIELEEIATA